MHSNIASTIKQYNVYKTYLHYIWNGQQNITWQESINKKLNRHKLPHQSVRIRFHCAYSYACPIVINASIIKTLIKRIRRTSTSTLTALNSEHTTCGCVYTHLPKQGHTRSNFDAHNILYARSTHIPHERGGGWWGGAPRPPSQVRTVRLFPIVKHARVKLAHNAFTVRVCACNIPTNMRDARDAPNTITLT